MNMTKEAAAAFLMRYVNNEYYTPQCQEAHRMAVEALREQENFDKLKKAFDRLGGFGELFVDYRGCPRGPVGRAFMSLEEEVLLMQQLIDADGGKWIPVNADALHELVQRYVQMREQKDAPESLTNADRIRAMSDEELEKFINHFDICDLRTHEECKISYCACCEVCVMEWLRQPSESAEPPKEDI